MNGSTSGVVPTVDLATVGNTYPYAYPMMGGYGNGGFFGGDGIWAILLIAILFGGFNNGFGGFGGNGWNNVATTDFVSSEFTQRDVTNGTQSVLTALSNGFSDTATNLCNVRSDVLTGNMALQNSILSSSCNTQRDILTQTNELNTNLLTSALGTQGQISNLALSQQAALDKCCCDIEELIRADGDETRALITQNTIQDLRDRLAAANDIISDERTTTNVINSLRPYPVPAYLTASPFIGYGNGFGWNGGFYGNGFYGNTIV